MALGSREDVMYEQFWDIIHEQYTFTELVHLARWAEQLEACYEISS